MPLWYWWIYHFNALFCQTNNYNIYSSIQADRWEQNFVTLSPSSQQTIQVESFLNLDNALESWQESVAITVRFQSSLNSKIKTHARRNTVTCYLYLYFNFLVSSIFNIPKINLIMMLPKSTHYGSQVCNFVSHYFFSPKLKSALFHYRMTRICILKSWNGISSYLELSIVWDMSLQVSKLDL
jgi:hypothetical protein